MAQNPHPSQRTYTPEQKIALVTEIDRRYRAGGGSYDAIARAVGTTAASYHNWVRAGVRPVPAPVMRAVEITALVPVTPAPAPPSAPVTLVTPAGYRVEGLTAETLVTVLRALS